MRKRIPFIVYRAHFGAKFQSKFNCLLEHQARVEYGYESSIVSEPRTLGGLGTTPLRDTYAATSLRRSKAVRGCRDFKYSSRVHRPSKYPAAAGNQLLLFRLFCNPPLLSRPRATKRHFGRISSRASVFIRLRAVYSPLFQLRLSN